MPASLEELDGLNPCFSGTYSQSAYAVSAVMKDNPKS